MSGIGTLNESGLHDAIKRLYAKGGYKTEVDIDGYVIDVIRGDELVEVQTKSFSSIKKKLAKVLTSHNVRLVFPLIVEKNIRVMDQKGIKLLYERKSPKKGKAEDILHELIYIPHLLCHTNLVLDVIYVNVTETRCDDGKGSWRRKGRRIMGRKLTKVLSTETFLGMHSYIRLLPKGLPKEFSSRLLRQEYGVPPRIVNKMLYVLNRMGVIKKVRKQGNLHVYTKINFFK